MFKQFGHFIADVIRWQGEAQIKLSQAIHSAVEKTTDDKESGSKDDKNTTSDTQANT